MGENEELVQEDKTAGMYLDGFLGDLNTRRKSMIGGVEDILSRADTWFTEKTERMHSELESRFPGLMKYADFPNRITVDNGRIIVKGVEESDVDVFSVDYNDGVLTIGYSQKMEQGGIACRHSVMHGFSIGKVDSDGIEKTYEDGNLIVTLPSSEEDIH